MKEIRSLYIHFPYCKEICNYCDFYKRRLSSTNDFSKFEASLEIMAQKFQKLLSEYDMTMGSLDTLYIGGGTPSLWGERGVSFLDRLFKRYGWELGSNGEHTLEINPEIQDFSGLEQWRQWGINRFSVGVQSCSDDILKRLNRTHQFRDISSSLDYIAKSGVNFSLDLMLNLPSTGTRDVIAELEQLLEFDPDHLSVYMMTVGSNYAHYKMLPMEEKLEDEYLNTATFLQARGYEHYEVSNFAKKGRESRHNLQYWKAQNMGALGTSATGFFHLDDGGVRLKWLASKDAYTIELLNKEDLELEKLYLLMRTNQGDINKLVLDRLGESQSHAFIKFLANNNYLRDDGEISLNSKGFLMMDSIMDEVFRLDP